MPEKNDRVFQMRASDRWLTAIDDWRRNQPDIPPRAESIRRLTALGIGAEPILRGMIADLEKLPADPELDAHIAKLRRLLGIESD